ncbi:MAG: putative IMPACT (imprinted ancient) family translation regulator, partial [Gammaproteobacteria bacterium]
TAGKPILNVLNHRGIGDILVVVTRYFGGVKLGAGGLVRAYSAATQQAIERLETELLVPKAEFSFRSEYALEPDLRRFIETQNGSILSAKYELELLITANIPIEARPAVEEYVAGRRGLVLVPCSNEV